MSFKVTMEDPAEVSSWVRDRLLGSGGFGTVTLWRNRNGGRLIAIKKCRYGTDNLLTPKQKERWKKEVDIMMKLDHPNVVKVFPLPDELAKLHTDLPVLCMEYCSKGDLRQILNRPENCCGLSEREVRDLSRDLISAIKYLHSQRITHRDLKPENIVLALDDRKRTLYKLIDLGYAKELDQSSVCTSFVGTLQYLAPEIFATDKYTSTVDYWSLGLVVHEAITGLRPFLPNMAPGTWMKHVVKKGPEHICAYQTATGIIEFSSHLFLQNHISSVFRKDAEVWLRCALEWDSKKRGRDPATNEIVIFSMMENILAKKVIRVFSLPSYQWFSYEYEDSTAVTKLQTWLETDTTIPVRDQEIVVSNRKPVDYGGLVRACVTLVNEDVMYVMNHRKLELPQVIPNLPPMIVNILQSPRDQLEYNYLKRTYSNAIYFLNQESSLYREFLAGLKIKLFFVVQQGQKLVRTNQQLVERASSANTLREFSLKAYKVDVAQVKEVGRLASVATELLGTWKKQMDATERKWSGLQTSLNLAGNQTQAVSKRVHDQQTSALSSLKEDPQLMKLEDEGMRLLDMLRRRSTAEKNKTRDSLEMVKVIYACLKHRDVILRDQNMATYCRDLTEREIDVQKALPVVESALEKMEAMKSEIQDNFFTRQRTIWQLVAGPATVPPKDRLSPSGILAPESPQFLTNSLSSTGASTYNQSPQNMTSTRLASQSPEQTLPHPPQLQFAPPTFLPQSCLPICHEHERRSSSASQHSAKTLPNFNLSVPQPHDTAWGSYCTSRHDSGIAGYSSLMPRSFNGYAEDDVAVSMIDENKSLRLTTQELMMQSFNQCLKLINEDRSMDWSFLNS